MFMFLFWLIIGLFMCYMNNFNINTLGWFFVIASPLWLTRTSKVEPASYLSQIFDKDKSN